MVSSKKKEDLDEKENIQCEKLTAFRFAIYTAVPVYKYATALYTNPIYTGVKFFISPTSYEIPLINIAYNNLRDGKEPFYNADNNWTKYGAYISTGVVTIPMYMAYKVTPEKRMKKIIKFIDKVKDKIVLKLGKLRQKILKLLNKVASKVVSKILGKDIDIAETINNFVFEKAISAFDPDMQREIRNLYKLRNIKLTQVEDVFYKKIKKKKDVIEEREKLEINQDKQKLEKLEIKKISLKRINSVDVLNLTM